MVTLKKGKLKRRLVLALDWLSDIAIKKEETIKDELNILSAEHFYWKGAIRNEYIVAKKKWNFYAPVWHSSQALKALALASQLEFIENKRKYLDTAKNIANFLLKNQVWDESNPDHGLLLAFEDVPGNVNTSGIFEAADGLFILSEITKDDLYKERILKALDYCLDNLYIKGEGLFHDNYDYKNRKISDLFNIEYKNGKELPGRPLNDDSVFLKAYNLTKKEKYKEVFWEIIERLMKEENPPGNWIKYHPCNSRKGYIHPRHAFWWGRPFIRAYMETKKQEYLDVAMRSGEWYKKAVRTDGGLFRNTYVDFNTDSFGHATSGTACAAILWLELKRAIGNSEYNSYIRNSLVYCMNLQFNRPEDKNLRGCVLEKILPPDGTDRSPYFIRDLGTIFFIQAATKYLNQNKI